MPLPVVTASPWQPVSKPSIPSRLSLAARYQENGANLDFYDKRGSSYRHACRVVSFSTETTYNTAGETASDNL